MKKSNKKLKSDRINTLRKQYDAFLEEDKKRKDRNDFILDKLDKMRSCTGKAPLHTIPTSHMIQQTDLYSRYEKTLEKRSTYERYLSPCFTTQQMPIEKSRIPLDDSTLLREISKNYILIPKLSSGIVKDYPETLAPITDPDSDWKSKYDILNKLKQNNHARHEDDNINSINDRYSENLNIQDESFKGGCDNKKIIGHMPNVTGTNHKSPVHFKVEQPEKDVSDMSNVHEPVEIGQHKQYQDNSGDSAPYMSNINEYENYETPNVTSDIINDLEIKISTTNLESVVTDSNSVAEDPSQEFKQHNSKKNTTTNETVLAQSCNKPTQEINCSEDEQIYIQEPIVNTTEAKVLSSQHHNENSMEQLEYQISSNDCASNNSVKASEHVSQNENVEYPIEIISVPDFTPDEGVELKDGVNVNPHISNEDPLNQYDEKNETVEEHTEGTAVDLSGIEEFDAEQNTMFYSEQPSENYAYNQNTNETTYQDYEQNENYQQNEEYALYENVQQEQNYPAEINEFEETSQPYDQTYHEQYATYEQSDYEQQGAIEPQQQQHQDFEEEMPNIEANIQPETEHLQYEQIEFEPQVIEQQLDDEEGYTNVQDTENIENKLLEHPPDLDTIANSELQNSEMQENVVQ